MPLSISFSVVFIIIIDSAIYITYFGIRSLARCCPGIPVNIVKLEANIIFINMRSQRRYQVRVTGELIILSMDILIGKHTESHARVYIDSYSWLSLCSQSGKQFSQASRSFHHCLSGKPLKSSSSVAFIQILAACLAGNYISKT